jgi:hypothetical protein
MPVIVRESFRELALPGTALNLELSNDGRLLACATLNYSGGAPVSVVNTADGSIVARYRRGTMERARGVAFLAGGRELVFLFEDPVHATHLVRAALDGEASDDLQLYSQNLHNHAIVRDPEARRFAVLGNQIEIRDATTHQVLHTMPGAHRDYRVHAMFSRDSDRIYAYGTVEKTVVCYEVASGREAARWEAPTRFGEQVLVTPDERFLVIAGTSHKGVFIYELASGRRVMHDKDELHTFDQNALWEPWAVSPDSSLLACLRSTMYSFRLPDVEDITVRKRLVDHNLQGISSASAWDAPVIAFGSRQDARVRWFELVPEDEAA